ncbi:hypothetical protein BKA62DRAFT_612245 [Auriculariales sp. MPI-PUGE-AT-0066]|nr:hypothetical protein BKA62DRAFT_612245 [Auriculariales sp. MPI-PUGE-AT-0066]
MGSKGKSVSVASFFDLKAEVAKHEDEFAREKPAGPSRGYVLGGVKRADKKPTIWARPNKGVAARAQRDAEFGVAKPVLEHARETLERKAELYDKLRKGKSGGLEEKEYSNLLVDFDAKAEEHGYSSSSDNEDQSWTGPRHDDIDPMVETQDEFGRTRMVRRSELSREAAYQDRNPDLPADDDPYLLHGDHKFFPTFQQSEETIAAVNASLVEEAPNKHYNAAQEVRAKGAAFYQFSGDLEQRERQMEELRQARDDTTKTRAENGAEDAPMAALGAEQPEPQSRGMAKRKLEIEERRRELEARKRRKHAAGSGQPPAPAPSNPPPPPPPSDDPFAMLESQSRTHVSAPSAADDFLNDLGLEMGRKQ